MRKITYQCQKIAYTLKRSRRAKRLRLTIHCDGNLVVTAPRWYSLKFIEQFMLEKSQWIINKIDYFKEKYQNTKVLPVKSKKDYLTHRQEAHRIIQERAKFFSQIYGVNFSRVTIRNQKTRWGSCSRNGSLNFNYKLILLSSELRDYVIVHELCHLKEFNHSPKFWQWVEKAVPDYKSLRKELKEVI